MPDVVDVAWRPTGRELPGQVADVMRDLPALLSAPLFRRQHLGWDATPQELFPDMPGDELFPQAQYRSTRAIKILPAFQRLETGQWVPMSPVATPSGRTALRVRSFEVDRRLLWAKPGSSGAWQLATDGQGSTRLITRIHAVYEWKRHPAMALFGWVLMEFGDFAMLRAILRGIKQRAERPDRPPRGLEART